MKTNTAPARIHTHEGGTAKHINPEQQLRRSVMSCLLWESEFYECGEDIAKRIADTIAKAKPIAVQAIAIEAREKMKLRHIPLFIVREMARLNTHKHLVADTLARVIQRADELAEFVSIYWKEKKQPLSAQVKRGLALAFQKFSEYDLAKYNRDGAVKLRDVLFLCHAKPKDDAQAEVWKKLVAGTLATPDTWEVELSASKDKPASWKRLLSENKLGALALLRNLRNMEQAGIEKAEIRTALATMKTDRVLPYRFIAAARVVPALEDAIEPPMLRCVEGREKLRGKTVLLVDVSSSMDQPLSSKSDLKRIDAANGLAILLREVCEDVVIYSFSMKLVQIPARRGFALRDAILSSQEHSGTPLGLAIKSIYAPKSETVTSISVRDWSGKMTVPMAADFRGQGLRPDRLIVISDEQSADKVPDPAHGLGYMLNVASARNGVGYGAWTHIDGFSEAVVDFVIEKERTTENQLS
jgi:hypothetical protein